MDGVGEQYADRRASASLHGLDRRGAGLYSMDDDTLMGILRYLHRAPSPAQPIFFLLPVPADLHDHPPTAR